MAIAENVLIMSSGIRNSLRKYTSIKSIEEYIWNGFDAKATKVDVLLEIGIMGAINTISIADNGYGINKELLDKKFKPFFQSEKTYDPDIKHSITHGKNGVGRLINPSVK